MTLMQKANKKAAKLTVEQVAEIRRLYGEGYTQGSICRHFGVTIGTIGRIVRGESWAEAPMTRELTALEHKGIQQRMLALQEQINREKAFEAEHALGERASPPPSPLDGGDAPTEATGEGLVKLEEIAVAESLDVEVALRRGVP